MFIGKIRTSRLVRNYLQECVTVLRLSGNYSGAFLHADDESCVYDIFYPKEGTSIVKGKSKEVLMKNTSLLLKIRKDGFKLRVWFFHDEYDEPVSKIKVSNMKQLKREIEDWIKTT